MKKPSADGGLFRVWIEGWSQVWLPGAPRMCSVYFGGAGVNPSRLRPGSGLGFGLGAFFTSFLPLSLLPMTASVPYSDSPGKTGEPDE
jgi:hypothetical protein